MPDPSIVEMCVSDEGYYLIRHTESGEFAGDTWHETREDALHQAEFEYGGRIASWTTLADGTVDFADVVRQLPHVTFSDAD
jgi:hypothetical protein